MVIFSGKEYVIGEGDTHLLSGAQNAVPNGMRTNGCTTLHN